jgi:hypothetical protein
MDRTLFYATAGWAFGNVEVTKATAPGATPFAAYDDVRHGWTVGAGIEQAFTDRISGRIEYRYTDLGEGDSQRGNKFYRRERPDLSRIAGRAERAVLATTQMPLRTTRIPRRGPVVRAAPVLPMMFHGLAPGLSCA